MSDLPLYTWPDSTRADLATLTEERPTGRLAWRGGVLVQEWAVNTLAVDSSITASSNIHHTEWRPVPQLEELA